MHDSHQSKRRRSHIRRQANQDKGTSTKNDERIPGLQEKYFQASASEDYFVWQESNQS